MNRFLEMGRAVAVLMLVTSIPLGVNLAFAEPDAEQEVIAIEQDESSGADADTLSAVSAVSDAANQDDTANAGKVAKKPEKKGKQADASILSANPDDANKHAAWRKREADKAISNMQTLRHSLMQQGGQ